MQTKHRKRENKMKKLNELNYREQAELAELLEAWLSEYTTEVIERVTPKVEEIINDDMSMMMLRELKARQEDEAKDRRDSFESLIRHQARGEDNRLTLDCLHSHPLSHSGAYRHLLYDLYINPRPYAKESAD